MLAGMDPYIISLQVRYRSFYSSGDGYILLPGFKCGSKIGNIVAVDRGILEIGFHFHFGVEIGKVIEAVEPHGKEVLQMTFIGLHVEILKFHSFRIEFHIGSELFYR